MSAARSWSATTAIIWGDPMLKSKTMDRVCCIAAAVMLVISVLMWGRVESVQGDGSHTVGYESLLFDSSVVHTIDIRMDDWDSFVANATAEEYTECNVTIDGEAYSHVAIRCKGNTSLSSVATLGSSRYSFKIEFNHFVKGMTYHGLDKLSLNNLIQDATMMKDYLAYTLMGRMGVPSSRCSYVQITVNGEPWGLYLAVEGVEDAFMDRNGMTKGELYKPDSMSFGGGRGNGGGFDIENFRMKEENEESSAAGTEAAATETTAAPEAAAQPAVQADADGDGGSFGGSSGEQNGDGASSGMPQGTENGMPSGMPSNMPGGDFAASAGNSTDASSTAMPEAPADAVSGATQEAPAGGTDSAASGDRGTPPEMPGGGGDDFGGFNFGGFNFGMGSEDVKLVYSDDNPDSYSNIFNNAKTKISKKDQSRLIESLRKLNAKEDIGSVVNTDEVIRYLAVHNFLCNDDSYTGMMVHNYYLYEENGKLSIIPWDYNLGFGGFSASTNATSTVNSPIDSPVSSGTTDSRPLIAWIFSDEEALEAYHEAYDKFISENIESGWLAEEISRVHEMITPYVEQDPTAFYTMDEFTKAVETLQTFCAKRGESIRGQLEGTIPSTSAGQRSGSALIDASEISTADMGSMNGAGGGGVPGGMPGGGGGPEMPGSGFSMPDMGGGILPEGFAMPEGMTIPEGMSMPGETGDMGGFLGGSTGTRAGTTEATDAPATDEPEKTAQPAEKAAEGGTTEQPVQLSRPERPSGMPEGMGFPGMEGTPADQSGMWIRVAICAAVLLAALLIIRRAGSHNQ